MFKRRRGEGSHQGYYHPPPPQTPERQEYAHTIAAEVGNLDEQWDVYYQHSQCYWYRNIWWLPETGRAIDSLSMFAASRHPAEDNIKYYNMHLPNGQVIENVLFRYAGPADGEEGWLSDYIGYNMNLVTFDMKVIHPTRGV
uniref:Uncharacterized protein n=1 Tax=Kwoniella dejecticola CBS 10117 TaxID=1296121 RepID=A0A1A6A4I6_9TREE|nr:uncharacterized protein I303_04278 [Kwoniella dejecticola CBS 10117]OBR84953.1 hypothetical protein I303_04278 [Kwoniella dejecticola CBS 10117]